MGKPARARLRLQSPGSRPDDFGTWKNDKGDLAAHNPASAEHIDTFLHGDEEQGKVPMRRCVDSFKAMTKDISTDRGSVPETVQYPEEDCCRSLCRRTTQQPILAQQERLMGTLSGMLRKGKVAEVLAEDCHCM